MKLLRVTLPAIVAFLLLAVLFAWVDQSALASITQPDDLRKLDSWHASNSNAPQASEVITKVLPSGDNYIHGLIYYNGYLYASTRSYPDPARVLKIDPNTLDVITSTTLTSLYDGEDIIAANGYLWVILFTEPARLVRVDPVSMAWNTAVTFTGTLTSTMGAGETLKYAFGNLWAGGRDHLARVFISDTLPLTYTLYDFSFLNLSTSSAGLFGSLAHDDQFLWGTYKQYTGTQTSGYFYASTVVKMDPITPTGVYTPTDIPTDTPDDSAYTGGAFFVSGEGQPNHTTPSNIYKFSSDPAVYTVTQAANSASYGLFANPNEPQYIWGTYVGSPGIVKKFDLNATPVLTVTLPSGFNDPGEIAFDGDGNVYVTTWQDPARIVKLPAQSLTSDLRMSVEDVPDPVVAGDKITYTLTITNDGPMDASGVLVTDTLPAQVSFVSSSPASPNCTHSGSSVTCNLGHLNALDSQQVVIVATVNQLASGTMTDTAQVTASTSDPDPQNNTAQEMTTIQNPPPLEADLLIGIVAIPNPVAAGQSITYTLTITNNGPSDASEVVITNTLPVQVSFVSSSPPTPACTHSGGSVTCNLGQLNALGSRKVTLMARVSDLVAGLITDTAQVTSSTSDPNQQNNSASQQTTVINSAGVFYRLFLPVTR